MAFVACGSITFNQTIYTKITVLQPSSSNASIRLSAGMRNFCFLLLALATISAAWQLRSSLQLLRLQPLKLSAGDKDASNFKIKTADDYLKLEDRPYLIGGKPDSGFNLAIQNFRKEIGGIFSQVYRDVDHACSLCYIHRDSCDYGQRGYKHMMI